MKALGSGGRLPFDRPGRELAQELAGVLGLAPGLPFSYAPSMWKNDPFLLPSPASQAHTLLRSIYLLKFV